MQFLAIWLYDCTICRPYGRVPLHVDNSAYNTQAIFTCARAITNNNDTKDARRRNKSNIDNTMPHYVPYVHQCEPNGCVKNRQISQWRFQWRADPNGHGNMQANHPKQLATHNGNNHLCPREHAAILKLMTGSGANICKMALHTRNLVRTQRAHNNNQFAYGRHSPLNR